MTSGGDRNKVPCIIMDAENNNNTLGIIDSDNEGVVISNELNNENNDINVMPTAKDSPRKVMNNENNDTNVMPATNEATKNENNDTNVTPITEKELPREVINNDKVNLIVDSNVNHRMSTTNGLPLEISVNCDDVAISKDSIIDNTSSNVEGLKDIVADENITIAKLYSYVNNIFCKLNSRIANITREVQTIQGYVKNKEEDKTITDLDSRITNIQMELTDFGNILKSSNSKQKDSHQVKMENLENAKKVLNNSIENKTNELKREIRENLKNANLQHTRFIDFKKEYERQVLPILNRINDNYMSSSTPHLQSHCNLVPQPEHTSKPDDNRILNSLNGDRLKDNTRKQTDTISGTSSSIETGKNSSNIGDVHSNSLGVSQDSKVVINCDVLFLGDSNLKPMKPDIMDHRNKCQLIYCPLLKDVEQVVKNAEIKHNVKYVYLQVGTNDLDHDKVETVSFSMSKIIDMLKAKFKCVVVISSILPRKDRKNEVATLNEYLLDLCDGTKKLSFMSNQEINESMLVDRKHLNENGFIKLLGSIRYTIFGKIPSFRKKRSYRQEEYGNAKYSDNYNYNENNRYNDNNRFMG